VTPEQFDRFINALFYLYSAFRQGPLSPDAFIAIRTKDERAKFDAMFPLSPEPKVKNAKKS
jgi:hypothetical protein